MHVAESEPSHGRDQSADALARLEAADPEHERSAGETPSGQHLLAPGRFDVERGDAVGDHPNLFVVDASFLPTSAAVNPSLTIAAQALRVADHVAKNDL